MLIELGNDPHFTGEQSTLSFTTPPSPASGQLTPSYTTPPSPASGQLTPS